MLKTNFGGKIHRPFLLNNFPRPKYSPFPQFLFSPQLRSKIRVSSKISTCEKRKMFSSQLDDGFTSSQSQSTQTLDSGSNKV